MQGGTADGLQKETDDLLTGAVRDAAGQPVAGASVYVIPFFVYDGSHSIQEPR